MHTILVIFGGMVLLAITMITARLSGKKLKSFLPAYLAVWFICAGVNMWVGVYHAGYSFMDELPIFLFVFGAPVVLALVLAKKF